MTEEAIEEKDSIAMEIETTGKIKAFIKCHKSRWESDISYISQTRQIISGSEWRQALIKLALELTNYPHLAIDPLNVVINRIHSRFTMNPLKIEYIPIAAIGAAKPERQETSLNDAFSDAFLDCLQYGTGYIYFNPVNLTYKRLDNKSVIMSNKNSADEDSAWVVNFDIIDKPENYQNTTQSGLLPNMDWSKDLEFDTEKQCVKTIAYRKEAGTVMLYEYIGEQLNGTPMDLGISEIPIFRLSGERVLNDQSKETFRGLYHKVAGLIEMMNVSLSRILKTLLTIPRFKALIPADAATNDDYMNILRYLNRSDLAVIPFPVTDAEGNPINGRPEFIQLSLNIQEYLELNNNLDKMIKDHFGSELFRDEQNPVQKTAAQILLERDTSLAAISHYSRSMNSALASMKGLVKAFGVSITEGYQYRAEQDKALQDILAIEEFVTTNIERAHLLPFIMEKTALKPEDQQNLINIYASRLQKAQSQQSAEQMAQELQQAQAVIQQLQEAQAEAAQQLESYKQSYNAVVFNEQSAMTRMMIDRETKLELARMNNESRENIKAAELSVKVQTAYDEIMSAETI
ncbi:MAG: hypothetical protein FWC26_04190 [Fibromonadales bacterium]|nr:hypothetical protein [Fibromonadales bacterium]